VSGVEFHRVQTEHNAVANTPGQPHEDIAGDDLADVEHGKTYDSE